MSAPAVRNTSMSMRSIIKETYKRNDSPLILKTKVKRAKQARVGAAGQPRRTHQEMSIQFAKELLAQGHHIQHRGGMEGLCTALAGSGLVVFRPHYTATPLSSASLLASYLKNRLLRNQEPINTGTIRKIIGLADAKNPLWNHSTSQFARSLQFKQSLEQLQLRREALQARLAVRVDSEDLQRELADVQEHIRKTAALLDHIRPRVLGNLHPDTLLASDKVTMTPSEISQLPSPAGTIRGILIRVKGPRKGNRAIKFQRSAGRVSINSVGYVVAEEASLQIPSKLGIYGLYIRIVYSKTDRLITPGTRLPILGIPNFTLNA